MYASISRSDPLFKNDRRTHQRVSAAAAASFKSIDGVTRLDRLYQQGSAKIRFPKNHTSDLEAVLINTAGGLTGGDRLSWDLHLGENAEVVVSTQACEKAYRSSDSFAQLNTQVHLSKDSTLHWVPQETILYERSALSRSYDVTMEAGATLLAAESIVLGREAMGENVENCTFKDRWRIKQDRQLIFADDVKIEGNAKALPQMNGHTAMTSLLFVNGQDGEQLQVLVRKLREICPLDTSGFSAFNGKITGRILAKDSYSLRQALVPVLRFLRGCELPRVWRI